MSIVGPLAEACTRRGSRCAGPPARRIAIKAALSAAPPSITNGSCKDPRTRSISDFAPSKDANFKPVACGVMGVMPSAAGSGETLTASKLGASKMTAPVTSPGAGVARSSADVTKRSGLTLPLSAGDSRMANGATSSAPSGATTTPSAVSRSPRHGPISRFEAAATAGSGVGELLSAAGRETALCRLSRIVVSSSSVPRSTHRNRLAFPNKGGRDARTVSCAKAQGVASWVHARVDSVDQERLGGCEGGLIVGRVRAFHSGVQLRPLRRDFL